MSISVQITAASKKEDCRVSASGSVLHVITDAERHTFRIGTDAQLKRAAAAAMGSPTPTDAFVRSPTPWGDLFITYGWPQTQTYLRPVRAEVLEVTSVPTIIKTHRFQNNSSITGTFNVAVSEQVSNTVESNWSNSNTVSVEQKIKYGVSFLGTGGGGETSFGYERQWGQGGSESTTVTVGSTSGVTVVLEPGQGVLAELRASRGTLNVRITYRAELQGGCALNYANKFQGHHFWRHGIKGVVAAAGGPSAVEITEDINSVYYSEGEVILKDLHGRPISHPEAIPAFSALKATDVLATDVTETLLSVV